MMSSKQKCRVCIMQARHFERNREICLNHCEERSETAILLGFILPWQNYYVINPRDVCVYAQFYYV